MSRLFERVSAEKKDKLKKKTSKEKDGSKYVDVTPELKEAAKDVAVISFGRMNPVTIGHEKLVNAVISTAMKRSGTPMIFLSHTSDKKKNPLTYDQKISFAQKAFGKVVQKSPAKTILQVAEQLQGKYKELVVVAGSDRVDEFNTLLNKYNGNLYTFDKISVVSAGERDPDAEGVEGMSASKMREIAKEGDVTTFKKGLPRKLQSQAQSVMDAVRSGMGLSEELEESEDLEEALTRQQRLKRKMLMRRLKSRIMMGRRRAMRRKASTETLKKRARRMVIKKLKQKFAKSNKYADLPYSARQRIDDRVEKIPASRIDVLTKRLLPKVKAAEKKRFADRIAKKNPTPILHRVATVSAKKESLDAAFENFLAERAERRPKSKLQLAVEMAYDLGANMNYAIKEIEGIKKGLSRHPQVKEALEYANENFSEESYQRYTFEQRMGAQDPDVKKLPGSQPKPYYKGVAKDKKDDRARHFAKNTKKSDEDPSAYEPAPGDAEAETKPSKHTKKFKQMFGETNYEKAFMKKPHMLLNKNGSPRIDKRFKMFRKTNEGDALVAQCEDLNDVMEAAEFIFESNPTKSLKDKAEKTGIPYGILKKVYDRGVAAWRTGHRPGTTPSQWGLARVNSFATKGKGTWGKADKDLADKVKKSDD